MTISHNFGDFSRSMQKAWQERDRKNAAGARKVAIQALADIQVGSPVDQGRFKASHSLSVDTTEFRPVPDGRDRAANETEAAERLQAAEARLGAVTGIPKGGMSIAITNNLPYANALEHGGSQQAPQGVYGIAAERAKRNIERLGQGPGTDTP